MTQIEYKNTGILYCAIGAGYLKQAELSYKSCRRFSPDMKASVYTDQKDTGAKWHSVITPEKHYSITENNLMIHKLDALISSPYENTLYLDSDTYVMDDISDLFELTGGAFDLAFCHGHNRQKRFNLINTKNRLGRNNKMMGSMDIPYCFSVIQGGLLLYNRTTTNTFFKHVRETYLERGYFDDQAIIRELLWNSRLRFYILAPEYNFNSIDYILKLKASDYKVAVPKIFHYTRNKGDDIERLIGEVYQIKGVSANKKRSSPGFLKSIFLAIQRRFKKSNT